MCTWHLPAGGMFLWLDVPGVPDAWTMIMEKALKKNVMLIPGRVFSPHADARSSKMRAAYSLAKEENMEIAMQRLAELIKEETA